MTAVLGISAYYHDSAAALLIDGDIVAAAQEERFSRKKFDEQFPRQAIDYCLKQGGVSPDQINYVAFYDKPFLKFQRLLDTYTAYAPAGYKSFRQAMPLWINKKLHLTRELQDGLGGAYRKRIIFPEHHESHAASAFFPSPYEEAAILTLDGVGEWATAAFGIGRANRISLTSQQQFPHSLGLLYSAFTYYCGFSVNSGEYKLMGLSPYGTPRYVDLIFDRLLDAKEDGSFRMDMSYFNYCQGLTMTSPKFHELFGGPPRAADTLLRERDMDIAASIQKVTEEIILRTARHVHATTGMSRLCLAGGVALNCVANGRLLREGPFEDIWIQPAAGDAGGALGAAVFTWYQLLDQPRRVQARDAQHGSLLGPSYAAGEIQTFLDSVDAYYERIDNENTLVETVANEIATGAAVGWFQGRMEFGPRALGSRSIIADARNPETQTVLNLKVKFREGFRPFAPAVLEEHASRYFELDQRVDTPYMLLVAPVVQEHRTALSAAEASATGIAKLKMVRSTVPAITHVDYSARVQTVDADRHGLYRKLLEAFYRKTGCPVLVNTSFNLGWDPIVCTPRDAYSTFMSCDLDVLCMGPFLIRKRQQPAWVSNRRPTVDFLEDMLTCPCGSGASLRRSGVNELRADTCSHRFLITDGIPQLFWPHEGFTDPADVTERVKAFYEETPFPNYDDQDSVRSLIEKARRGRYARDLDAAIPYNSSVLEIGCGTGQLSNFLGVGCRRVVGADLSLNSLRLGEEFRRSQSLSRVRFTQVNLFKPPFKPGLFDVVLCNGVLQHTSNPRRGFNTLVSMTRPGGVIVIGLYNMLGRLMMDARRVMRAAKRHAWFSHQYLHPHESKHTIGEVLDWFDEEGVDFVRGVPSLTSRQEAGGLFTPAPRGTRWQHVRVQATQIFAGSEEGGLFIMIGRRRAAEGTITESKQPLETEAVSL